MKLAKSILNSIYEENPKFWPYGLNAEGFDDLYVVFEKKSHAPAGFLGWQTRCERDSSRKLIKSGYYSVGVLPAYRQNGYAKAAVAKLIAIKSASVDRVQALIMSNNRPSLALAGSLGVEVRVKQASSPTARLDAVPGILGLFEIDLSTALL